MTIGNIQALEMDKTCGNAQDTPLILSIQHSLASLLSCNRDVLVDLEPEVIGGCRLVDSTCEKEHVAGRCVRQNGDEIVARMNEDYLMGDTNPSWSDATQHRACSDCWLEMAWLWFLAQANE